MVKGYNIVVEICDVRNIDLTQNRSKPLLSDYFAECTDFVNNC